MPERRYRSSISAIDPHLELQVEGVFDQFENMLRDERPKDIALLLKSVPDASRGRLLSEMVLIEKEFREQRGQPFNVKSYLESFPEYQEVILAAIAEVRSAKHGDPGDTLSMGVEPTGEVVSTTSRTRIGGYEILQTLAAGGMGVVYKALQPGLNRLVSLKMIRFAAEADSEELLRFRREVEAVARLQHPNIVQIFEVGLHGEQPFFSMEYVSGGTLADWLRRAMWSPAESAELMAELAQAVHFAHQNNVIHRDLKPANVLLARKHQPAEGQRPATGNTTLGFGSTRPANSIGYQGVQPAETPKQRVAPTVAQPDANESHYSSGAWTAKIADFGLAKQLDSVAQTLTRSEAVMGTPTYMSPEQAAGRVHQIGPATDIYALGAILYELLTGRPPLRAATTVETLELVCRQDPVAPRQLNPAIPRDLETICLKCLAKEPTRRYATAAELADDLGRYLRDEPIHARPISALERAGKFVRRNPAWATVGGVLLIAILSVLAVSLYYGCSLATKNTELTKALGDVKTERNIANTKSKLATEQSKLATDRYDSLRRTSYATSIKQADSYYSAIPPNLAQAYELLNTLLPPPGETDLRGPEWRFLQRAVRQENLYWKAAAQIESLSVSPSGELQLTCHATPDDYLMLLQSNSSGKPQSKLINLKDLQASRVVCSRHGDVVLSIDRNHGARLRRTARPEEVVGEVLPSGNHSGDNSSSLFAVSDDGALVAWVNLKGEVHVWSRSEDREIKTSSTGVATPYDVIISPDNRYVLVFSAGRGAVLDLVEDKRINIAGDGGMVSAAFSPNSKLLAIGYATSAVELVHLEPGGDDRRLSLFKFQMLLQHLEFTADGEKILVGSRNNLVAVLHLNKSRAVILRGHRSPVSAVCRGAQPHQFFTAGENGEVLVWDDRTEEQRATLLQTLLEDGPLAFSSLAYSPEGDFLLCGATSYEAEPQGSLVVYDTRDLTQRKSWKTPASVRSCSFSGDGKQVYWLEHSQERFENTFRRRPFAWQDQTIEPAAGDLVADSAVVAEGGTVLVSDKGSVRRSSPDSVPWPRQSQPASRSRIRDLLLSPDGKWLLSTEEFVLRLWNVAEERQDAWCPIDSNGHDFAFSADGRFAAWIAPGRLLRDLEQDRTSETPPVGPDSWEPHHRALVFNLMDQKIERIVSGHAEPVKSLALSADGRRLLTGDGAGIVKMWDTATGQELISFNASTYGVSQLAIHPQGRQFVTLGTDGIVRVWHCE